MDEARSQRKYEGLGLCAHCDKSPSTNRARGRLRAYAISLLALYSIATTLTLSGFTSSFLAVQHPFPLHSLPRGSQKPSIYSKLEASSWGYTDRHPAPLSRGLRYLTDISSPDSWSSKSYMGEPCAESESAWNKLIRRQWAALLLRYIHAK